MKQLKAKVLLTIGMVLSSVCMLVVQAQPNPETQAKRRTQSLTKSLNLTEEQSAKVSETFLTFFTKMSEIREADLPQAERRKANQQHVAEREKNLKEILTPEQWEKLTEIRRKEREARQRKNQN